MKRKNGFISISIIYSFFIIFLIIMLAMLASYTNKRYLKDKVLLDVPVDSIDPCESGDSLADCIKKTEATKKGYFTADGRPDTKKLYINENVLTPAQLTDDVEESGLYAAPDDYTRWRSATGQHLSLYYRGDVDNNYVKLGDYIWRIVRINGNETVRLIYQGRYNSSAGAKQSKVTGSDYITVNLYKDNGDFIGTATSTKYNSSSYNSNKCAAIELAMNVTSEVVDKLDEGSKNCAASCPELWGRLTCLNITCSIKKVSLDIAQEIEEDYEDFFKAQCASPNNQYGAHLLHNIGYMNNEEALLYRYDSKYDNQNSSDIKEKVDLWYTQSGLSAFSSVLSNETIFCGDKNRTKCASVDSNGKVTFGNCEEDSDTDEESWLEKIQNNIESSFQKSERYYYSGWERIVQNNTASFICPNTGSIASNSDNRVYNLSRYNVSNLSNQVNSGYEDRLRLYANTSGKYSEYSNLPYVAVGTKYSEKTAKKSYDYTKKDQAGGIGYATSYQNVYGVNMGSKNLFNGVNDYDKQYATLTTPGGSSGTYSYRSSLEYLGNGDLTYPIGLLSADEAIFAGLQYNSTGTKSYLLDHASSNEMFWTMTLSYADYTSFTNRMGAYYFAVKQTKKSEGAIVQLNDYPKDSLYTTLNDKYGETIDDVLYVSNIGAYIRPVINVNVNLKRCSGNGTESNPYIVSAGGC